MKTVDRLDEIIYQADKLKDNVIDDDLTEAYTYKTILKEIREVANGACNNARCRYDCKVCSYGKIIDKINEVLNDKPKKRN